MRVVGAGVVALAAALGGRPGFAQAPAAGSSAGRAAEADARHRSVAVVSDLASAPDLRDVALGVSLLVRSMLVPGQHRIASRVEIAGAMATAGSHPDTLAMDAAVALHVMEKLGADRLFLATLGSDGHMLQVSGAVIGPTGDKLAEVAAMAPVGEIAPLARELARKMAPRVSATFSVRRSASVWHLRPFIAAATATLQGDVPGAMRALRLANPRTGASVTAVAEIGELLSTRDDLPPRDQLAAAIATADDKTALRIAHDMLVARPDDPDARAGRSRALMIGGKLVDAEDELRRIPSSARTTDVAVARADLALRFADRKEREEALAPLLRDPATRPVVLALITGAQPGVLPPVIEKAALDGALRLAKQEPALASAVGFRALAGDVSPGDAAALVHAGDFSLDELDAIRGRVEKLAAAGNTAGARLAAEIRTRDKTLRDARAARRAGAGRGPRSPSATQVAALLTEMPALASGRYTSVLGVPLPGSGQPFYWPIIVDAERFGAAVSDALAGEPFSLEVSELSHGVEWTEESATPERLAKLSDDGVDLVLLHRIRPQRLDVLITVVAIDVAGKAPNAWQEFSIPFHRTELARLSPIPVAAGVLAFLGLLYLAFLGVAQIRGSVVVTVIEDPGAKDEVITLIVSRNPEHPPVRDIALYEIMMRKRGKEQSRARAYNVGTQTRFSGLPSGRTYVHLVGIYTKAQETRAFESGLTQQVIVRNRHTEFVTFNLVPNYVEFYVEVMDGPTPVKGARAWVQGPAPRVAVTDENGRCFLMVPKGQQVIMVEAKGTRIPNRRAVYLTTAQELKINLVWERRVDDASRALEGPSEETPVVTPPTPKRGQR